MTIEKIKDIIQHFNNDLITVAHNKGITPKDSNEALIILIDELLTNLCKAEKLELRKFIYTIPHKDEETGEAKDIEGAFLITDLKEYALQFELKDLGEITTGSKISTAILSPEDLKPALENIYTDNCIELPIDKIFLEKIKANYSLYK